jgi:TolB-like protein
MTPTRKFKKIAQQWKKTALIAIVAIFITGVANAQKPKLAVMDFMAGVGLYQNDVNGLSDMLINLLFNTGRFEIIERGQLSQLIGETNLQKSSLSTGQLQQLAIKGVNFLLLGTANLTGGEFNVDVRIVDVGTGQLYSTAGVTKLSTQTYREMMPKLANELSTKLPQVVNATVTVSSVTEKPKVQDVITLLGYLKVYPEDLGTFSSYPYNVVQAINDDISFGYNTWRLPTDEELSLLQGNRNKVPGLTDSEYQIIEKSGAGRIRLVTNRRTYKEYEKLASEYTKKVSIDSLFQSMLERQHKPPYSATDSIKARIEQFTHTLTYMYADDNILLYNVTMELMKVKDYTYIVQYNMPKKH